MPQLIIEQPGVPSQVVPLTGRSLHLGRAEDNDVVLVADEVSRHHAKILRQGNEYLLLDLNSLNGTYANRQRIIEHILQHLDEIWFGSKCRLVYRDDTGVGRSTTVVRRESSIIQDLDQIRAEMDRVADNMTLISKRMSTPSMAVHARPGVAAPPSAQPTPQPYTEEVLAMSRAYRRLSALYGASKLLAGEPDLNQRLSKVLDMAIEVAGAERGFVMLKDENTGQLRVSVAREMGRELEASSPSMGIAGRAAIDGEPVLMADRDQDEQFGGRESIIRQHIVSAMCVPLKIEDRVLGSIYVDTRQPGRTFAKEDLELFASLAAQSALAIENVRLYEKMVEVEKKRSNLGRFLSPTIVEEVMREDTRLELGGRKKVVTTLFCDIRGFTVLAERLGPAELLSVLNEHFTAMTEIIFHHQGTLDKYNGDEVMALFGAPLSGPDDALRAVRAAMAMQAANAALNRTRVEEKRPQFDVGIGIDTGEVIAGYVGSPERLDFTVVGDRVNTARHLCTLAQGGQVIIGESTYELVKNSVVAKAIGTVILKGKEAPVHAFEILEVTATSDQ